MDKPPSTGVRCRLRRLFPARELQTDRCAALDKYLQCLDVQMEQSPNAVGRACAAALHQPCDVVICVVWSPAVLCNLTVFFVQGSMPHVAHPGLLCARWIRCRPHSVIVLTVCVGAIENSQASIRNREGF